jgi:hypothetical protein
MALKTGGNIQPCKVADVEAHNRRDPEYLDRMSRSKHPLEIHPELALRPNEEWSNTTKSEYMDDSGKRMTVANILNRMIDRYKEKDARHRRPPLKPRERINKRGEVEVIAGWSPIREMIVVIKPDTKLEEFDKVKDWFAHYGVNVISSSCHFDEGRENKETGAWHCNNHAHMVLDFFDWQTGKTIKLGEKEMSELQTVLADALGMERGELKERTGREHLDVVEQRLASAEKEAAKAEERLANAIEKEQQLSQKKNDGVISRIFSFDKDKRIAELEGEVEKWQDMWQSMYKDYLAIKPAAEMGRKLAENARQEEREKVREEIEAMKKQHEKHLENKDAELKEKEGEMKTAKENAFNEGKEKGKEEGIALGYANAVSEMVNATGAKFKEIPTPQQLGKNYRQYTDVLFKIDQANKALKSIPLVGTSVNACLRLYSEGPGSSFTGREKSNLNRLMGGGDIKERNANADAIITAVKANSPGSKSEVGWGFMEWEVRNIAQTQNSDEESPIKGMHEVACHLFLGQVEAAGQIALSHGGGGGGGSSSGWGRGKDDDDDLWWRKCMARAKQMMKPSTLKQSQGQGKGGFRR